MDYVSNNRGAHAFNLGNDQGHSVLQVIKSVEKITGKNVPHTIGPRRPGDPPELISKSDLARSKLGWSPVHSDLDTIIDSAWAWLNRKP